MAKLGTPDPRLIGPRNVDLRLRHQLKSYEKADPAPSRVQPAPLQLIRWLVTHGPQTLWDQAVRDLTLLAFFFLCRPGEYTCPSAIDTRSAPFRLLDVTFYAGERECPAATASFADIRASTAVYLIYTDQKNCVRGERIGHCRSGDPMACPVIVIGRRVLHLRTHNAPSDTPLYMVFFQQQWRAVRSNSITQALRVAAHATTATLNITPARISARSLRAGGAMALLCAGVTPIVVKMVARWQSDTMMRYLHVQALPHTSRLARDMVTHGHFTLLPHSTIPPAALPLLTEAAATAAAHPALAAEAAAEAATW